MTNGRNAFLGFVIGLFLGIPASYFLQSGVVRAKLSLGSFPSDLIDSEFFDARARTSNRSRAIVSFAR